MFVVQLHLELSLKNDILKPLLMLTKSLTEKRSKELTRLRMMEDGVEVSATMIYNYLRTNHYLRRVKNNIVLGIVDFKRSPQPLFFVFR